MVVLMAAISTRLVIATKEAAVPWTAGQNGMRLSCDEADEQVAGLAYAVMC